ncbi:MAG: glucuronate isomerase [Bacteroidota bacterium]
MNTSALPQLQPLIQPNWLLSTASSRRLYHDYAASLPIIDYHNHLAPDQLAQNYHFDNLTEAWLAGDHYKWRAMRALGIPEEKITGAANDYDKFLAYAQTLPYSLRNPLFHWSQLELKRYFDVDEYLNKTTAPAVYEQATAHLQSEQGGTWGLLQGQNVRVVCTTDDPLDELNFHQSLANNLKAPLKMLPTWRPDKCLLIQASKWRDYIDRLASVSDRSIQDYQGLLSALELRMDYFAARGCSLSDHGLEFIPPANYRPEEADRAFRKAMANDLISQEAADTFLFTLLVDLGKAYADRKWVMQLHLGALRNNNRRAERELGPDTGYDSIGDFPQAVGLSRLLDQLNDTDQLPKTILYNLNPADNEVFATMIGNFAGGGQRGKIQWGSGWWFLDQWDGMQRQIDTLSNMGLLSCFVGMLTDSRSFLSYPRHEYFRRLLCELFGRDMESGKLPQDFEWVGGIVQDICYHNAAAYFDF